MKKKYCKAEIEISDEYDDFLLSSSGIIFLTEDDRDDTIVDDIFAGWWL